MKLLRVGNHHGFEYFLDGLRHAAWALESFFDPEHHAPREATFFLVDDSDSDAALEAIARQHPGQEIQVYELVGSGVCPPAALVRKQVTKDGILPI